MPELASLSCTLPYGLFFGVCIFVRANLLSKRTFSFIEQSSDATSGEDFDEAGRYLLKWIVNYRRNLVSRLPVISKVSPNYLSKLIPVTAPTKAESWQDIFKDLNSAILPGLTNWESSSKFFAYFKPHSSYPAVLGELLCAGLNVMGFDWIASPACTELEVITLDWLAKFLNLPDKFFNLKSGPGGSVIQGSAGEAAIVATLAAINVKQGEFRQKIPSPVDSIAATQQSSSDGNSSSSSGSSGSSRLVLSRDNMVVFVSDQAHAIVKKACMILGVGHFHIVPTDASHAYAMQPAALQAAIEEEIDLGRVPLMVVATTGTTSSCAFDPVQEIASVAKRYGAWIHIDAAYGGAYACLPQLQPLFLGLELCDSFVVNCHKKLLCPFDLAAMYVADRRPLLDALSLQPEYLRNAASESGAVVDYEHWQLPLGRRFRALKLWFVFRRFGAEGVRIHVQRGIDLSSYFTALLLGPESCGLFELAAPVSLSLVCFRLKAGTEADQKALLDNVKATGDCFVIHTKLSERLVLRFACGGIEQTETDVRAGWSVLLREAKKVMKIATAV